MQALHPPPGAAAPAAAPAPARRALVSTGGGARRVVIARHSSSSSSSYAAGGRRRHAPAAHAARPAAAGRAVRPSSRPDVAAASAGASPAAAPGNDDAAAAAANGPGPARPAPSPESDSDDSPEARLRRLPPPRDDASVLQRLSELAIPLALQNVAGFTLSVICSASIGRLGAFTFSAAMLANAIYNCTGAAVTMGVSAGMETLCGQAYGARNYPLVGLFLQRAILVCAALCVPIAALWLNAAPILEHAMGQEPALAAVAGRYLGLCIPALFLSVGIECLRRYLVTQRAGAPAALASGAALLTSPLWFWLFVFRLGWGLDGAAAAFAACESTTLLGLIAACVLRARRLARDHPERQTWPGWDLKGALRGWGEYLSFGLPAAALILVEWLAYELCVIASGWLPGPEVAVAASGILMSVNGMLYMPALGLAAAVNTCVSNALGAADAERAGRTFRVGLAAAFCLQAAVGALLAVAGRGIFALFCPDPVVIEAAHALLPVLVVLVSVDGINATLSGTLRGAGRQALGAGVNAAAYWAVGVPLSGLLAFKLGMGAQGLWGGICLGASLQTLALTIMLLRWDWGAEVERAAGLLERSRQGVDGPAAAAARAAEQAARDEARDKDGSAGEGWSERLRRRMGSGGAAAASDDAPGDGGSGGGDGGPARGRPAPA
jgi:MATE family multidrug resistance protein